MKKRAVPALSAGQVLLRTLYLSLDLYMRGRISDRPPYGASVAIDKPKAGQTVVVAAASGAIASLAGQTITARALTSLVGNGLATVVISRWEGELHRDQLNAAMVHPIDLGEALERDAL